VRRLRSLLSDGFWLYLFPALAVVMPWRWYFALCRRMTRARHPYRAAVDEQLGYAATLLPDIDRDRFRDEQALIKFVDAADFYLNLARSHRWFRRHVRVEGEWPAPGALLLLGSHWGAAHWIWRDLAHRGIRAWFVARHTDAADFGRGRLARWYGRFRGWGIRRAGCAGVVTTGGARSRIEALLARGDALVVLNDVPVGPGRRSAPATLLGRSVNLPVGAIDTALRGNARFALFAMALDPQTGRRTLSIQPLPAAHPVDDAAAIVAAHAAFLDPRLRTCPGSWQIWSLAPQLFAQADQG
jgi:hypothetical protein